MVRIIKSQREECAKIVPIENSCYKEVRCEGRVKERIKEIGRENHIRRKEIKEEKRERCRERKENNKKGKRRREKGIIMEKEGHKQNEEI